MIIRVVIIRVMIIRVGVIRVGGRVRVTYCK